MGRYAQYTRVEVGRSQAEIARQLERYGATGFMCGWQGNQEAIGFVYKTLKIQITIPKDEDQQIRRQRWRALLLVVKAKLEAIESGISTIEEDFLAWIMTPSGKTLGQLLGPQLEAIDQKMPRLLMAE